MRRASWRVAACAVFAVAVLVDRTIADPSAPPSGSDPAAGSDATASNAAPDLSELDAFHAVREANRKLLSGDADRALELYDHAAKEKPDAREIAFGRGLSHYAKKEFDLAKEEFLKAAAGKGDSLGADAAYAAAACDHAAALGAQGDPKPAVSKLENAMRGYRDVLSAHPDHRATRDADRKAAATWRELKRQLQQQKQKQPQQQKKEKNEPQDDQEKQEQKPQSSPDSEKQQQERASQQKQGSDQENQKQDSSSQEEASEENQQSPASAEQQGSNQQQQQAEKESEQDKAQAKQEEDSPKDPKNAQAAQAEKEPKEDVSREQAERKLREMMQAVRQRRKDHRETSQPVQVMPVDKDW